MYAKVTISLPEELLAQLDDEAREAGISRSELVKEAAASYLGKSAEERRRESVQRAIDGLGEMRKRTGRDARPTLEILREIRETDDAADDRCAP